MGILGCGAIGTGIARSLFCELKATCRLDGIYDPVASKITALENSVNQSRLGKKSFHELLRSCDLMVEATNADNVPSLIRTALEAKKHVLVMSVGQMLHAKNLFSLARRKKISILIPSGAIAGIDAIKAASLSRIDRLVLTTRKPLSGLSGIPYLKLKGIDPLTIDKETVVFEGNVASAVKYFPQNINVAATLALASGVMDKIVIRIVTSPEFKTNSHEIDIRGEFGQMLTRTENVISPENPKTSYLAVLSGIQTLKDFCSGVRIGT